MVLMEAILLLIMNLNMFWLKMPIKNSIPLSILIQKQS